MKTKEAAALPGLLESGGLPCARFRPFGGASGKPRAGLRLKTGAPLFVLCPDDTTAENFANDLRSMLGEEVTCLGMRDFTFYSTEAASRQAEQKRLAALFTLAEGRSAVTVASIPGRFSARSRRRQRAARHLR